MKRLWHGFLWLEDHVGRVPAIAWRRVQFTSTLIWALLIVPSVTWWQESVPWLVFMSVWTAMGASMAAWQGTRAEEANNASTEP